MILNRWVRTSNQRAGTSEINETVWDGVVLVFDVADNPNAKSTSARSFAVHTPIRSIRRSF
jgi:hypothetical protein